MKLGIGLPNTIPGTPGNVLVEWARRAEERGFSTLATIDRIAYPSYDSLTALAAVAGATNHIGLLTNILIAPLYRPALLAKTTASVDQISGGRLTLGLAPGGRSDDFAAVGHDFGRRGPDFDAALEMLHRAWSGEAIGGDRTVCPQPVRGRVPVLIGGGERAVRRIARWGEGWTMAGAALDTASAMIEQVRTAWRDAGRDGEPRFAALVYYSLGDDTERDSYTYLRDYYGFVGEYAEVIAESALRSEPAIRNALRSFEEIGFDELYFDPTAASVDQVDRLADVLF